MTSANKGTPPTTRAKIRTDPQPRNMRPEKNKERRTLRVKAMLKQINKLVMHTELYYMDASLRKGTGVTVAVDINYKRIIAATERDLHTIADLEITAIARARTLLQIQTGHRHSLHLHQLTSSIPRTHQ